MWFLHPCNREWPLPKATEAKLNGFAWLALGLPAFLAGKSKDEEGEGRRRKSVLYFLHFIPFRFSLLLPFPFPIPVGYFEPVGTMPSGPGSLSLRMRSSIRRLQAWAGLPSGSRCRIHQNICKTELRSQTDPQKNESPCPRPIN